MFFKTLCLKLALFCLLFVASHICSLAQESSLNFPPTVTLKQFLDIVARETNTVFVYDQSLLRGELSITAPPNISASPQDIFVVFEKLLRSQRLTLSRQENNMVQILPMQEARFFKAPIESGHHKTGNLADYVVQIIKLKHADVNQIKGVITPFTQTTTILNYDPLDLLILVDTRANISRLMNLIERFDVDSGEDKLIVSFKDLKYVSVGDAQNLLNTISTNLSGKGRKDIIHFVPVNVKNQLAFIATQKTTNRLLTLLEKIDTPNAKGVMISFHQLKNASAAQVSNLLGQIFQTPPAILKDGKLKTPEFQTIPPKIIPFENILVILATPSIMQDILDLVEQIDIAKENVKLQLAPLKYASAQVLAPLLSNIFSNQVVAGQDKGATAPNSPIKIIAEPRINALILIAMPKVIDKILGLIANLDIPKGNTELQVVPLKYASASKIQGILSQVLNQTNVVKEGQEGGNPTSQNLVVTTDTRLNALIIYASSTLMQQALQLVKQLDIDAEQSRGNFKIYELQYAVAENIVKTLSKLTGNIVEVSKSQEVKAPETQQPSNNQISISADQATNSLIVFGPSEIFVTLDKIIAQLDVPRVQVYIEALVMETNLNKSLDFGVDWTSTIPTAQGDGVITTGFPNGTPLTVESAAQKAGRHSIGVIGGGALKFQDQTYLSFGAFIRASQNDSDINVLAHPELMMLNNQKSQINVSRVIPVATNSTTDANGRVTDQIEFRDVGVILSIRPQISGDNHIRLEIEQKSSDVSPVSVGQSNAITTFKRELKTTVISENNSIIVLGGLLNEQISQSENKVPGLGDIPLLGWFFRSEKNTYQKTNLLMFIRPKIVRNRHDMIRVTEQAKKRYKQASESRKSFREMLDELQSTK